MEKYKLDEEEEYTKALMQKWAENAKEQTLETLPAYISNILDNYEHDYGTICHAMATIGVAAMWAANKHDQGGVTGFQAGAITWLFIQQWNPNMVGESGARILNFDDMLYPQYEGKFDKTIPKKTWERLQKQAAAKLDELVDEDDLVSIKVLDHWNSINSGIVPFGYTVEEE